MLKIEYSGRFMDQYVNLVSEEETIKEFVAQAVKKFRNNPQDARLKNHSFHRRMKGKWAFSVTDDIRIIYQWLGKTTVRLLAIGHHSDVYSSISKACS